MKNEAQNIKMFYSASPLIHARARELRKRMTEPEKLLWQRIRNRKIKNIKFRRQHPIDIFIADFYSHEIKLVIELDGGIHNIPENIEKDKIRTIHLELLGITVIRFKNKDVFQNIEGVIAEIEDISCSLLLGEKRNDCK